jgi:penicillin amidase
MIFRRRLPSRSGVRLWRDRHGVVHVEGQTLADLCWGQGVAHATDRGLQMLLMRIVGQGRASELLRADDASLRLDIFLRRMNWTAHIEPVLASLPPEIRQLFDAYCEGVSAVFARRCPWEVRLLGYRPEPWRPEEIIMLSRLIGYVSLQQGQARLERLCVEMVQAGIDREKLEELFPCCLNGLDEELIRKVKLGERVVPERILWQTPLPRALASNNWVVSGRRTSSGKPLLANDPHLEGNRLPNVWCENVLHLGDRYIMGASMPGGPGIILGRNNDVAWGVTYAPMDCVDSWIERCKEGKYYREGDDWVPFRRRTEIIRRRKKEPVEVAFYENDHGVLDGDPNQEGYYLATRWAADRSGGATITQFLRMWDVRSVEQGMDVLGQTETCWNWVLADRQGNIGYQMSGLMPRRRAGISGFVPLPGWKPENDWQSFVDYRDLPRCLNPAEGYFATANEDLNPYGTAKPINNSIGPYRAERIRQLLADAIDATADDMADIQFDIFSTQAQALLEILKPLLPPTPHGDILRNWDCRYTADSRGAHLFERVYIALVRAVFGPGGLGDDVIAHLTTESGVFVGYHYNFDRVLLRNDSAWFAGRRRDDLFRQAIAEALATEPKPWGEVNRYTLRHLLFGKRLPAFLGFDRASIPALGSRATIHQGQLFRSSRRETAITPSIRIIADMATDELQTTLEGGPSDRRFSRWYCSDLTDWFVGRYKTISGRLDQPKNGFP